MLSHTEFNWREEIDGETFNSDCLNRAKYAEFLTAFLKGQNQSKPYVLNLNSEWGSGKTYFLKRWKHDLSRLHPVIYIDAWRNDYSDDPLMSVVSSVITQLREKTDKNEESALSKGYDFGTKLIKQVAPIIAGGLAKKYIGIALDDISVSKGDGVESPNSNEKIDKAAQKITSLLMSEHDKKASSISSLKKIMKEWIDAVIGQNSQEENKLSHPTFIIIDELDRCRPTHAVETLEIVKHIFDIPGVFFVIATDTNQLQHAIKAVYGSGFDAHVYLSRFFDMRFNLKPASLHKIVETHCNTDVFSREFQEEKKLVVWPIGGGLKNVISILDEFGVSARDAVQIINKLSSILLYIKSDERLDMLYLTTLLCLQAKDPSFQYSIGGDKPIGELNDIRRDKIWLNSNNKITFDVFPDGINDQPHTMEVCLHEYFLHTFASYVQRFGMRNTYSEERLGVDVNEIRSRIRSKAMSKSKIEIDGEFSTFWLRHSYIQHNMGSVIKYRYNDYVELATAFD